MKEELIGFIKKHREGFKSARERELDFGPL